MINILKKIYYLYYRPKIFFPKSSYSMHGEDIFISDILKHKYEGFYVDVGCYHPFEGNNTYLLYKKNWRGINIDVNPFSIEPVSYTHLRAHETPEHLVWRLLL